MHLSRLHRGQSHRRWDQGISENPSSQSMTHDTYDTCFHKIFSRAHAGKTYIYFKKKIIKEKVIKTRCHICHVSHLSHESTYHNEPLIILNHPSFWTRDFFEHVFFWTRITRITRIFLSTRISQISRICQCFAWLTDIFFDLSFKPQQVNNHNESITTTSQ